MKNTITGYEIENTLIDKRGKCYPKNKSIFNEIHIMAFKKQLNGNNELITEFL